MPMVRLNSSNFVNVLLIPYVAQSFSAFLILMYCNLGLVWDPSKLGNSCCLAVPLLYGRDLGQYISTVIPQNKTLLGDSYRTC